MKYITTVSGREIVIEIDRSGEVRIDGESVQADLQPSIDPTLYSLLLGQNSHELRVEPGEGGYHVRIDGISYQVVVEDERTRRLTGVKAAGSSSRDSLIKAPMPGVAIDVAVKEGDTVTAGQTLVVIESMKMHNEFKSPRDGTIGAVRVAPGEKVNQGQILITLS